ncbi:MAG: TetR/AcrR family transcriptional regulator [Anaerolineae bacterium]
MSSSEPANLRERIIEEATRLFVSLGYHAVSMREIAEAAGVSKAGLYYHFKDKESLLLAILTANLDRIAGIVAQARPPGATAREQIGWILRSIFQQPPEQRAIIRLSSQEMAHLSEVDRAEFGHLYRERFTGALEAILRAGIERGELRSMDARVATWVLLGMAYPFLYSVHERELGPPGDAIELMLSIFFDGASVPGE